MIFTENQSNSIYDGVYDWLSVQKPGDRYSKGRLKYYQKNIWEPIIQVVSELSNKSNLREEEKEFLKLVVYNGTIFRIQRYSSRAKGYIEENGFYQSWSSGIDGIANITNYSGNVLLIIGDAVNGIDVFGLLCFLMKYKKITKINLGKYPDNLCKYEKEQEIEYPILSENIKRIIAVDKVKIQDWKNNIIEIIPKSKWKRN
ncbi:hypothetical protein [Clostridium sp. YIM B02555]|uniref:hypothetical protein n=1 Tax=Clostridium sp. YIM B02555 TaxID=2911968 RepID=UPI001EEE2FE6|nr:hypothetical protein [Clostridium sp. YIM B02555]